MLLLFSIYNLNPFAMILNIHFLSLVSLVQKTESVLKVNWNVFMATRNMEDPVLKMELSVKHQRNFQTWPSLKSARHMFGLSVRGLEQFGFRRQKCGTKSMRPV
ncbi:hypothetical protein ACHQM5_026253 [Ranunculus cassubicifolius]